MVLYGSGEVVAEVTGVEGTRVVIIVVLVVGAGCTIGFTARANKC